MMPMTSGSPRTQIGQGGQGLGGAWRVDHAHPLLGSRAEVAAPKISLRTSTGSPLTRLLGPGSEGRGSDG
jgi:hypothetical protein